MLADVHTHSEYSEDAKPNASIDAICRSAISRGIDVITITDHKDFFFTKPPMTLEIDRQRHDIAVCQKKYAGQLKLLSGVELGEIHASAQAAPFAQAYDFDEVIGSLHIYRKNDIDFYFQNYAEMDLQQVLQEYFTDLLQMVQHGGFDILAHIDYPLRVMKLPDNHPTYVGFEAQIEPILRTIIDKEIAFEVNAASLFSWRKQAGPEPFIMQMYYALGGRMLTFGSDSHCAPDLGRGMQECLAYIRQFGFSELVYFENRKPKTFSI